VEKLVSLYDFAVGGSEKRRKERGKEREERKDFVLRTKPLNSIESRSDEERTSRSEAPGAQRWVRV
jgi:hypothetical protein